MSIKDFEKDVSSKGKVISANVIKNMALTIITATAISIAGFIGKAVWDNYGSIKTLENKIATLEKENTAQWSDLQSQSAKKSKDDVQLEVVTTIQRDILLPALVQSHNGSGTINIEMTEELRKALQELKDIEMGSKTVDDYRREQLQQSESK